MMKEMTQTLPKLRFHLNNSQATLHYFVAYFISSEELYHMSYVIILDTSGV